jgi:hypothetical protein
MLQVGFEPTIPVFEWAKIVYALDHEVTVIGTQVSFTVSNRKKVQKSDVISDKFKTVEICTPLNLKIRQIDCSRIYITNKQNTPWQEGYHIQT